MNELRLGHVVLSWPKPIDPKCGGRVLVRADGTYWYLFHVLTIPEVGSGPARRPNYNPNYPAGVEFALDVLDDEDQT